MCVTCPDFLCTLLYPVTIFRTFFILQKKHLILDTKLSQSYFGCEITVFLPGGCLISLSYLRHYKSSPLAAHPSNKLRLSLLELGHLLTVSLPPSPSITRLSPWQLPQSYLSHAWSVLWIAQEISEPLKFPRRIIILGRETVMMLYCHRCLFIFL